MATRICVEWMTHVPKNEVGDCVYDCATWNAKGFKSMDAARRFAKKEVARNEWGQVWIKTEHADREDALEWQWETDHDATEIIEAERA